MDQLANRKPGLLQKVRSATRVRHMSIRTEEAYVKWIVEYLRFHKLKRGEWVHPEKKVGWVSTHHCSGFIC